MKRILIAGALSLMSLSVYAKDTWIAKSEMIESSKNFALVMGSKVQQKNVDPSIMPLTFAYQTADAVDLTVANLLNAGWTCDNTANAIGGKMEVVLKDPTLTEIQHKMFKQFQSSVVNYVYSKCADLGGK